MAWQFDSDRPIYAQLVEQIKRLILSGAYPPGSKLPSVRDLASQAAVNPNTMQKALAELETDGLLFTQRTAGRFVTEDDEAIQRLRQQLCQGILENFIQSMTGLGFTPQQALEQLQIHVEGEKR